MALLSLGLLACLLVSIIVLPTKMGGGRFKYVWIACWLLFVVAYNYFFAFVLDASNLTYNIFSVPVPFFAAAALGLVIAVLFDNRFRTGTLGYLVALALVVIAATGRPVTVLVAMLEGSRPALERFIYQLLHVTAFTWCVLVPVWILTPRAARPWDRWFALGKGESELRLRPVLLGTIAYVLIMIGGNLIFFDYAMHVRGFDTVGQLAWTAIMVVFFHVLVNHFISFGITRELIDKVLPGRSKRFVFFIVAAAIFALLHYYFWPYYIVTKFLIGIVLAYLYEETGSLTYGIVLNSLFLIFVP